MFKRIVLALTLALACVNAWAATYYGRASTGAFVSVETSQNPADTVTSNNSTVVSNRLYGHAGALGWRDLEATADLRDKYDMFGRLDSERLKLTPSSELQAYQVFVRAPPEPGNPYATVGRFALPEAGGRFVDGAEAGYSFDRAWRASAFGGLNPKRDDQETVGFNQDAQTFGALASWQPNAGGVATNALWSTAVAGELASGHLDRLYWFNNALYSWSRTDQVFAVAYLDFQPRIELQDAVVSAHHELTPTLSGDVNLTAVDVIEYTRRQGFFETLPSSAYREAALNGRVKLGASAFLDTQGVYGARQADGFKRIEVSSGPAFYHLFGDHASLRAAGGARRNFTGNDVFGKATASWFSTQWEVDLTANYTLSTDTGPTLHESTDELAVTSYFSRDLFAQASFEAAWDENVTIWATSIRLSYAFGIRGRASPLDQAPPPLAPLPAGRVQ